jgi:hypothetical protein
MVNINSGNWVCKSAAGGTRTTVNSGTAVTFAWHTLRIVFDGTAANATCYVDGTSIGTLSSNLPTGSGNGTTPHFQLLKTLGTGQSDFQIDYFEIFRDITAGRT